MSQFIHSSLSDIRGGRESWRVMVFFCIPAFLISILSVLGIHHTI